MFDKPTELTVEFSAESSIELKWVAPEVGGSASNIQNFAIRVVPGNMTFTTGDTRTEISPLIASTNYNISVIAVGSNGKLGVASDILNATTGGYSIHYFARTTSIHQYIYLNKCLLCINNLKTLFH